MKVFCFIYNILLGAGIGTLTATCINLLFKIVYENHPPVIYGLLTVMGAYSIAFYLYNKISLKS